MEEKTFVLLDPFYKWEDNLSIYKKPSKNPSNIPIVN